MLEARTVDTDLRLDLSAVLRLLRATLGLGALATPPPAPPEEIRLHGRLHSRNRDTVAISHHYDVGNDFYRLVLGDTMTYSCAYFERDDMSLDEAQTAKYDLVCRKLGLKPGMRLLDVGCGWGSMVLHAVRNYGVSAVGITLSREQASFAAQRVAESDVGHLIDIRYQDYRDVGDGPFDTISSIGMFEHVGLVQLVGLGRAKVWRLYMAGSALSFERHGSMSTRCSGSSPMQRDTRVCLQHALTG